MYFFNSVNATFACLLTFIHLITLLAYSKHLVIMNASIANYAKILLYNKIYRFIKQVFHFTQMHVLMLASHSGSSRFNIDYQSSWLFLGFFCQPNQANTFRCIFNFGPSRVLPASVPPPYPTLSLTWLKVINTFNEDNSSFLCLASDTN